MHSRCLFLAALICSLSLRAEIKAPQPEFKEYLVAPVRVHLLVTKGELNLTTTLERKDITRIFGKVNRIWGHAGIHLPVEQLIKEPPIGRTTSPAISAGYWPCDPKPAERTAGFTFIISNASALMACTLVATGCL